MKILIDECVPRDLKYHLESQGRECLTVQEMGYSGKKNGELLALAENNFDVFLTLDKNLQYQQNLTNRNIALSPRWRQIERYGRHPAIPSRLLRRSRNN